MDSSVATAAGDAAILSALRNRLLSITVIADPKLVVSPPAPPAKPVPALEWKRPPSAAARVVDAKERAIDAKDSKSQQPVAASKAGKASPAPAAAASASAGAAAFTAAGATAAAPNANDVLAAYSSLKAFLRTEDEREVRSMKAGSAKKKAYVPFVPAGCFPKIPKTAGEVMAGTRALSKQMRDSARAFEVALACITHESKLLSFVQQNRLHQQVRQQRAALKQFREAVSDYGKQRDNIARLFTALDVREIKLAEVKAAYEVVLKRLNDTPRPAPPPLVKPVRPRPAAAAESKVDTKRADAKKGAAPAKKAAAKKAADSDNERDCSDYSESDLEEASDSDGGYGRKKGGRKKGTPEPKESPKKAEPAAEAPAAYELQDGAAKPEVRAEAPAPKASFAKKKSKRATATAAAAPALTPAEYASAMAAYRAEVQRRKYERAYAELTRFVSLRKNRMLELQDAVNQSRAQLETAERALGSANPPQWNEFMRAASDGGGDADGGVRLPYGPQFRELLAALLHVQAVKTVERPNGAPQSVHTVLTPTPMNGTATVSAGVTDGVPIPLLVRSTSTGTAATVNPMGGRVSPATFGGGAAAAGKTSDWLSESLVRLYPLKHPFSVPVYTPPAASGVASPTAKGAVAAAAAADTKSASGNGRTAKAERQANRAEAQRALRERLSGQLRRRHIILAWMNAYLAQQQQTPAAAGPAAAPPISAHILVSARVNSHTSGERFNFPTVVLRLSAPPPQANQMPAPQSPSVAPAPANAAGAAAAAAAAAVPVTTSWCCDQCSHTHSWKYISCPACDAERPESRPDSWLCRNCDRLNHDEALACVNCSMRRPKESKNTERKVAKSTIPGVAASRLAEYVLPSQNRGRPYPVGTPTIQAAENPLLSVWSTGRYTAYEADESEPDETNVEAVRAAQAARGTGAAEPSAVSSPVSAADELKRATSDGGADAESFQVKKPARKSRARERYDSDRSDYSGDDASSIESDEFSFDSDMQSDDSEADHMFHQSASRSRRTDSDGTLRGIRDVIPCTSRYLSRRRRVQLPIITAHAVYPESIEFFRQIFNIPVSVSTVDLLMLLCSLGGADGYWPRYVPFPTAGTYANGSHASKIETKNDIVFDCLPATDPALAYHVEQRAVRRAKKTERKSQKHGGGGGGGSKREAAAAEDGAAKPASVFANLTPLSAYRERSRSKSPKKAAAPKKKSPKGGRAKKKSDESEESSESDCDSDASGLSGAERALRLFTKKRAARAKSSSDLRGGEVQTLRNAFAISLLRRADNLRVFFSLCADHSVPGVSSLYGPLQRLVAEYAGMPVWQNTFSDDQTYEWEYAVRDHNNALIREREREIEESARIKHREMMFERKEKERAGARDGGADSYGDRGSGGWNEPTKKPQQKTEKKPRKRDDSPEEVPRSALAAAGGEYGLGDRPLKLLPFPSPVERAARRFQRRMEMEMNGLYSLTIGHGTPDSDGSVRPIPEVRPNPRDYDFSGRLKKEKKEKKIPSKAEAYHY